MKILELFSGTECLSNAFRARGHQCFTVDWDTRFPSSLHIDIMQLTAGRILTDLTCRSTSVATRHSHQARLVPLHSLLHRFGQPDIIWAGCDCTTFSVAAIGHHRRKDPATGSLAPKTERAARADQVNRHTLGIIRSLRPRFFFIENPMGGLRKMDYMRGIPRHLITYCQYGFTYRKATDIWTNHPQPEFLPPCRNGDPCHQPAPRGTRQGLQGIQDRALRSAYPPRLCEHIVSICERYFDREPLPVRWHIDAKPPVQLELF